MADGIRTRLFVEADLAAGVELVLAADRAHYLLHVLRLGVGESVALFNGRDGEWSARVVEARKNRCTVTTDVLRRPQAIGPDLWLLFAPLKRQAIDLLAQKATELGAARLQPVVTARTVAERVAVGRLQAIAVEAAEQCERLDVPVVEPPGPLLSVLSQWPDGRRLFLCNERAEGRPIAEALAGLPRGPAAILVGPEGGFTPGELDGFLKLPFVTAVGLGPRILRAETAALAALALWQALHGDWADPPRRGAWGATEGR